IIYAQPPAGPLHHSLTIQLQDQAMRTHYCGDINETLIDQTVTFSCWVHRRRDHGGVIFLDVRDREGMVQVVFDPDTPEAFATADSRSEERRVGKEWRSWTSSYD